jgi:hypothetical protein
MQQLLQLALQVEAHLVADPLAAVHLVVADLRVEAHLVVDLQAVVHLVANLQV